MFSWKTHVEQHHSVQVCMFGCSDTLPDKIQKRITWIVLLDQCCIGKELILHDIANMINFSTVKCNAHRQQQEHSPQHCYQKNSCGYSCESSTITVTIGAYSWHIGLKTQL